jgi:hypothetical protein
VCHSTQGVTPWITYNLVIQQSTQKVTLNSLVMNNRFMIWIFSVFFLTVSLLFIIQMVAAQEEIEDSIYSVTPNDTTASQIVRNLEKLIEQNNDASRNAVISSYITMMAFLVGLALVIFGLQLSRGERLTVSAIKYYRILILALILPVVGLFSYALITLGETHSAYLGVLSLLMIPAGAVLVLMASKLHKKL